MSYPQFIPDGVQANGLKYYFMNGMKHDLEYAMLAIFADAIATFEGFYIENSISQRHNNPGNLRPIGASTGFRTFPTENDGWAALSRQIVINIKRQLTLREFFLGKEGVYPGYAPLGDNPAETMENYIAFVEKRLNIDQNDVLSRYFPIISQTDPLESFGYISAWTYKPFWA